MYKLDEEFPKYLILPSGILEQFRKLLLSFIALDPTLSISPAAADAMTVIHNVLKVNERIQDDEAKQSSGAKIFTVAGDWHIKKTMISLIEKCAALSLNSLILSEDTLREIEKELTVLTSSSTVNLPGINRCCDQLMKIKGLFFSSLETPPPQQLDNKKKPQNLQIEVIGKLAKLKSYFVSLKYWELSGESNKENRKTFFHAMPEGLKSNLSSIEKIIENLHEALFLPYSLQEKKSKRNHWLWDINNTLEVYNKLYNSYLNAFRSSQSTQKPMKVAELKRFQANYASAFYSFLGVLPLSGVA